MQQAEKKGEYKAQVAALTALVARDPKYAPFVAHYSAVGLGAGAKF
jgi:hypothetical protein